MAIAPSYSLELRNRGFVVNHKKVQRLIAVLGLAGSKFVVNRKYSSYRGIGKKEADNLIQRKFKQANQWKSAIQIVTEFAILFETLFILLF